MPLAHAHGTHSHTHLSYANSFLPVSSRPLWLHLFSVIPDWLVPAPLSTLRIKIIVIIILKNRFFLHVGEIGGNRWCVHEGETLAHLPWIIRSWSCCPLKPCLPYSGGRVRSSPPSLLDVRSDFLNLDVLPHGWHTLVFSNILTTSPWLLPNTVV